MGCTAHGLFTHSLLGTAEFMALAFRHQPRRLFALWAGLRIPSLPRLCWTVPSCGTRSSNVRLDLLRKLQNPKYKPNSAGFAVGVLTKGTAL